MTLFFSPADTRSRTAIREAAPRGPIGVSQSTYRNSFGNLDPTQAVPSRHAPPSDEGGAVKVKQSSWPVSSVFGRAASFARSA